MTPRRPVIAKTMKKKKDISKIILANLPVVCPNRSPKEVRFLLVLKYPKTIRKAVNMKLMTIRIFKINPVTTPIFAYILKVPKTPIPKADMTSLIV